VGREMLGRKAGWAWEVGRLRMAVCVPGREQEQVGICRQAVGWNVLCVWKELCMCACWKVHGGRCGKAEPKIRPEPRRIRRVLRYVGNGA